MTFRSPSRVLTYSHQIYLNRVHLFPQISEHETSWVVILSHLRKHFSELTLLFIGLVPHVCVNFM